MLLSHLVLGGGQPLPQLALVKLLLGTDGLPDVRHVRGLKVTGHNTTLEASSDRITSLSDLPATQHTASHTPGEEASRRRS